MVRFIIFTASYPCPCTSSFTFQYGQIYYSFPFGKNFVLVKFYIPIWLDLLFSLSLQFRPTRAFLHSNMVRFIIFLSACFVDRILNFTFQYGQIYYITKHRDDTGYGLFYIPIWLDLLLINQILSLETKKDFTFQYGQIYYLRRRSSTKSNRDFTFQYGQIYYRLLQNRSITLSKFYIPIWLDLLFVIM